MKKILLGIFAISIITILDGFAQESEYLMPAKKYGKWGFINMSGDWIISSKYEEAYYFSEGVAAVKYYGNWGYIDRTGEWTIQPVYRNAKPFKEGLACAMKNNTWGYIDKKGAWHFEPKLAVVSSFSDGKAIIKADEGFIFINRSGDRILKHSFDRALPFAEGLAFSTIDLCPRPDFLNTSIICSASSKETVINENISKTCTSSILESGIPVLSLIKVTTSLAPIEGAPLLP